MSNLGSALTAVMARLQQHSFERDTLLSMGMGIVSRLLQFASLPLLAFFYAPADIGLWSVLLSVTGYLIAVATMRLDIAIVTAKHKKLALVVFLLTLVTTAAVVFFTFVATQVLPDSFWSAVSGLDRENLHLLGLAPILLLLLSTQVLMQSYLTREKKFLNLGLASALQAIIVPVVSIGILAFVPPSGRAAAIGAMAGIAAGNLLMLFGLRSVLTGVPARWCRLARLAIERFKVYPTWVLPYSLSRSSQERIVQVIFVSFYPLSVLGMYSVARQLLTAPAILLASSLRLTMFAHSAREPDPVAISERVNQVLQIMIVLLAPAVGFAFFWLVPVLKFVMPPSWSDIGIYAWWCLFPASLLFLVSWLDRVFDVIGRQRLAVGLQLSNDAILAAIAIASPFVGLSAIELVALLSVAQTAYSSMWLVVLLRLLSVPWHDTLMLGTRAAVMVAFWTALQGLVWHLLPNMTGLVIGTIVLAAGMLFVLYRLLTSGFKFVMEDRVKDGPAPESLVSAANDRVSNATP
jgi:O-antigen/teichoic acid export membrane protein